MTAVFDEDFDVLDGLARLFERSNVALTIGDLARPDCPLVGANQAFFDMSGYGADEVIGKNCRFLQPADGAGPVRARMRRFLTRSEILEERFLIPNETKGGERFLNLVYMAKIDREDGGQLVLGSQFQVGTIHRMSAETYDRALKEDLRQLKLLTDKSNWVLLGSLDTVASSHSIIARLHYE